MAKYLVETYYTCTFKVNHYLDDINEAELKNLEKRDDGKFEVLDVKYLYQFLYLLFYLLLGGVKL